MFVLRSTSSQCVSSEKTCHVTRAAKRPNEELSRSELLRIDLESYGRPSPPKIQGCQIDQQIHRWLKDQLQDSIANKGMAWPNYIQSSFP